MPQKMLLKWSKKKNNQLWLLGLLCLILVSCGQKQEAVDWSKTLLTVNNTPIFQQDVQIQMQANMRRFAFTRPNEKIGAEQLKEFEDSAINQLIDRELLNQEAIKSKISVSFDEVEQNLNGIKSRLGTEENYKQFLIASGKTEAELRKELEKELMVRKIIMQNIYSKINLTEDEILERYEKVKNRPETIRASHIVLLFKPTDTEEIKAEKKQKLIEAKKRILAGENFDDIAKELSEDMTGQRGGDLGYFPRGVMDKSFEDAAFALKIGEVSDVVETRFGYHLIKLTDRKDAYVAGLDEVRDEIERVLHDEKGNMMLNAWLQALRSQATIVERPTFSEPPKHKFEGPGD